MIWGMLGVCVTVIMALCGKIVLMRKAADEIREGISYRLRTDTNTLLDIASRDKTMRALAECLNDQLRILRRQRQIYDQGNLELKEAVTNISHDIRTPLTAIRGYLELLENEDRTENTTRYLNIISERTETLSQLTEELFQYTVSVPIVEQGNFVTKDLGRLLEESVLASYASLMQNGINPDVQLTEGKVKSKINEKAARRVIENILNNAIKYSDGDLHITLNEQGEVLFANHAAALDEVQTGRLFDRFYTVENARTATGLGLAIAKQLTEQMGGSIAAWYEDEMLYLKLTFPVAEE